MKAKNIILGLCLAIILMGLVFVLGNKIVPGVIIASKPQVLGVYDSPALFPTARTFAILFQSANRFGDLKQIILNFWAAHFEILIDGRPYDEVLAINPNIKNMASNSITYGASYDYDNDIINWGGLLELDTWVKQNWNQYPWSQNYASAAAAFEDCFIHVNQNVTAQFAQTPETYTIPAYDPANPRLSRLAGPWDRNYDWMMNLGSPVYISFWQDYYAVKAASESVDGLFLDSTGCGWIHIYIAIDKAREYAASPGQYNTDMRNLVDIVRASMKSVYPEKKLAINNYSHFETADPSKYSFEDNADMFIREGGLNYRKSAADTAKELTAANRVGAGGKVVLIKHQPQFSSDLNRDKMAGLAAYYLAMNDNVYFLSNENYGDDPRNYWFEAIEYDIGRPAGSYNGVWATGSDPSNPSVTYKVFSRRFTKALVLFKPTPVDYRSTNYFGLSATTHQLGAAYRRLNADGTLGDPITSITLRNWEGAILLENDATAPSAIQDLNAS
jgi:hypothetical protein